MAVKQLAPVADGHICWSGGSPLVRFHRQQHLRKRPELIAQYRDGRRWWLRNGQFCREGRQQMATNVNKLAKAAYRSRYAVPLK